MNKIGIALFAGSLLMACGGGQAASGDPKAPAAATASTAKAAVKAPGEATVGDRTTCPVSREEFTVTTGSPKVDHGGKSYYFCCPGCDAKFKENPAKYLTTTAK